MFHQDFFRRVGIDLFLGLALSAGLALGECKTGDRVMVPASVFNPIISAEPLISFAIKRVFVITISQEEIGAPASNIISFVTEIFISKPSISD